MGSFFSTWGDPWGCEFSEMWLAIEEGAVVVLVSGLDFDADKAIMAALGSFFSLSSCKKINEI